MIVSKNSWHYRMLSYFPWEIQAWRTYSLCKYFWLVVWTFVFCIVCLPLMAVFAVAGTAFFLWVALYPILQIWFPGSVPVAVLSAAVDTTILVWLWCEYRKEYVKQDMCSETATLVAEYVHAKHRKVCPILQFENSVGEGQ